MNYTRSTYWHTLYLVLVEEFRYNFDNPFCVLRNDTKRIVEIVTKFFDKYKIQSMSICRSGVIHEIMLIPFLWYNHSLKLSTNKYFINENIATVFHAMLEIYVLTVLFKHRWTLNYIRNCSSILTWFILFKFNPCLFICFMTFINHKSMF